MTETASEELCRDIQMKLPDVLWMLDYTGRYRAGRFNEDFARTEDGRTYLFGVIEVPLAYAPGEVFTWGVWAEVDPTDHDRYLDLFQTEGAEGVSFEGRLANDIPGYEDAVGSPVRLTLHAARRPDVTVSEGELARDQKKGLSLEEHRWLDEVLFGPDDVDDKAEEEGAER